MWHNFASCIALVLLANGCGDSCTDIGCIDGVRVTLATPVLRAAQELVITVDSDGTKASCTIAPAATSCMAGALTVTVQDEAIRVFEVAGTPERIGVTIASSTTTALTGEVRPRYETVHPNGSNCPGACKRADAILGG